MSVLRGAQRREEWDVDAMQERPKWLCGACNKSDYVALGQGPRAQGPDKFNPARDSEGLEDDRTDPAGQHLVAQMVLALLQPWDSENQGLLGRDEIRLTKQGKKSQGDLTHGYKYLMGGNEEDGPRLLFPVVPSDRQEATYRRKNSFTVGVVKEGIEFDVAQIY
ncbi:hypothetical protein GRJ2_000949000 [Grus japonensis]|uniref:Uncharacterized protein n=1 Tax=Grus japonensis TaxID=30415 RepID=A0ABC9WKH6_GRUJA